MRDYFCHWALWLLLTFCCCALPANAEPTSTDAQELFRQQLDVAEQTFPQVNTNRDQLDKLANDVTLLEQQTQTCLSDYGQQQNQAKQAIDSLGAATIDESPEVKRKRKELTDQQQQIEKTLSQCRLSSLRATTLLEEISRARQTLIKARLFTPSASLLSHITALMLQPALWQTDFLNTMAVLSQPNLQWRSLFIALLYGVAGLSAGLFWRKQAKYHHQARLLALATTSPTLGYVWRYVQKYLPYLLFGLLMWLSLYINPIGIPDLPETHLLGLSYISGGTFLGITLITLVWVVSGRFLFLQRTRLYLLAAIALVIATGSLWLGYYNFAHYLFWGVSGTLIILLIGWMLIQIPTEIFDGLDEGRVAWQQELRQHLGIKEKHYIPGLIWLRLTITLSVVSLGVVLLLRLWGMPAQYLTLLLNQVSNGFQIAGFTLEPLRIITGLLVIAVIISVTHVVKNHLAENWLQRTGLSKGAQETASTVSGYIGILFAIILGLSVAGIEFKNLAIIAGALSVGIGFGLQNIVNNFVSGLILLFERPIRKGDWIKVGNAEGYVRDISIRSTTIQTFDHSDIIVPNSELIAGQVTNMMLTDNVGRISLPISVAYGSNAEQIMQILRTAADTHPSIIHGHDSMKITVLFRSFADSNLNFELRCFVREIETRASVISDLNLAIDKAFRQFGVEIPTPQRTVH